LGPIVFGFEMNLFDQKDKIATCGRFGNEKKLLGH
jgi:hypothetical protein